MAGHTPATISICISEGAFVCDFAQRCDSGLFRSQLDLELPARDRAPTVRAFLAHVQGKQWGRCLQADLVCFREQAQLDLTDPATVLVGGTVDILSVHEARESAFPSWVGGTGSSNACGAGTQIQLGAVSLDAVSLDRFAGRSFAGHSGSAGISRVQQELAGISRGQQGSAGISRDQHVDQQVDQQVDQRS